MKSKYHGNRNKTLEMLQEELDEQGIKIKVSGVYTKALEPVGCECLVCGHRWDGRPNSLLRGTGCNKCAKRINPTQEEFQKEIDGLGKNFTVSGDFSKSTNKLLATCNVCGFSWQSVSGTLRRKTTDCAQCKRNDKLNPSQSVINKSISDFQSKLDLLELPFNVVSKTLVDYKSKVKVQCLNCGHIRENKPDGILTNGCAKCSGKLKSTLQDISNAITKYGHDITLSGEYKSSEDYLDCHCNRCGHVWKARAGNLKTGRGCRVCCRKGFNPNKSGNLYYLRVTIGQQNYWKIGITNLSVRERFRHSDRNKLTILYFQRFENGAHAALCEKEILKTYSQFQYQGPDILDSGNTEIFSKDVLQMDHLYWGPI